MNNGKKTFNYKLYKLLAYPFEKLEADENADMLPMFSNSLKGVRSKQFLGFFSIFSLLRLSTTRGREV